MKLLNTTILLVLLASTPCHSMSLSPSEAVAWILGAFTPTYIVLQNKKMQTYLEKATAQSTNGCTQQKSAAAADSKKKAQAILVSTPQRHPVPAVTDVSTQTERIPLASLITTTITDKGITAVNEAIATVRTYDVETFDPEKLSSKEKLKTHKDAQAVYRLGAFFDAAEQSRTLHPKAQQLAINTQPRQEEQLKTLPSTTHND